MNSKERAFIHGVFIGLDTNTVNFNLSSLRLALFWGINRFTNFAPTIYQLGLNILIMSKLIKIILIAFSIFTLSSLAYAEATDKTEIKNFLYAYRGKGALGVLEFDANGDQKHLKLITKKIVNGESVVWP